MPFQQWQPACWLPRNFMMAASMLAAMKFHDGSQLAGCQKSVNRQWQPASWLPL